MEILLWLVPAAVMTMLAAFWAAYVGREQREDDDPAAGLARIGEALKQDLHRRGR